MPIVIPAGFSQAAVEITIPGDAGPALLVFGYEQSPLSSPDDNAAAVGASITKANGLQTVMTSDCFISSVTVRQNDGDPFLKTGFALVGVTGIQALPTSVIQVCALLKKGTGFAGRSQRGRMYIPGVPEAQVNAGGFYTSAYFTSLVNTGNEILTELDAQLVPMVLLHSDPALTPSPVTSLAPDAKAATQRRRLR